MPSMLWGEMRGDVPGDENVVRRGTFKVSQDTPAAEAVGAPDRNEVETDSNPELGMVNRQVAGDYHESEQYSPFWSGQVDVQDDHNAIVDRQVSTSGTAAAREQAGQFGHGTMPYSVAIEPVADLSEGGKLGNDYFVVNDRDIQDGAGNYMSIPPGADQDVTGKVSAQGKDAAREAGEAATIKAWYAAAVGS